MSKTEVLPATVTLHRGPKGEPTVIVIVTTVDGKTLVLNHLVTDES